jgi:hypothetical protein
LQSHILEYILVGSQLEGSPSDVGVQDLSGRSIDIQLRRHDLGNLLFVQRVFGLRV